MTMYKSYLNRIGRMAIVWNRIGRMAIVKTNDHSWSGLHVRLYIRSHTVSRGLVRSLIRLYTDMASVSGF